MRLSPDGRRPLVLALVPSLIRATPASASRTPGTAAALRYCQQDGTCSVPCGLRKPIVPCASRLPIRLKRMQHPKTPTCNTGQAEFKGRKLKSSPVQTRCARLARIFHETAADGETGMRNG